MKLTQTVAPATEPITLSQARAWLAFDAGVTEDDSVIADLIGEVRGYLERRLAGRKLITQTWTIELDEREVGNEIFLPILPLQSISSIKTYDDAGTESTMTSTYYQARIGEAPRIVLTSTGSWATMRTYDSVLITAVVGYGDADDLPDDIVMLLKGLVLHMYHSKGTGINQTVSGQLISIPHQYEKQIKALKVEPWV